jgi:16S rRNA G966 N2-methylase RsmD
MAADEFEALRKSIREGFDPRHPITLCDGKILDGRHRYLACVEEGVAPEFEEFSGGDPFAFVLKEHDGRRSFESGAQKHLCKKRLLSLSADWVAKQEDEQRRIREEARRKQAEAAREQENRGNQYTKRAEEESAGRGPIGPASSTPKPDRHPSREAKAKATGTTPKDVRVAEQIERLAEELGDAEVVGRVEAGDTKAYAALKDLQERKRAAQLAMRPEVELPEGIFHGDFRELSDQIPDASVELIFTDPPYDKEAAPLYEAAAEVAARILKPGGSMIAYTGQRHLPEVLSGMSKHLAYWWTVAGVHGGGAQMLQKLGIRCGWKPLVWFVKTTRGDVQNVIRDVVVGEREKHHHAWQQAESEAEYFIRELCPEGGTVVDFFLGGGTTAAVAQRLGRRVIGYEIDGSAMERIAQRLRGGP